MTEEDIQNQFTGKRSLQKKMLLTIAGTMFVMMAVIMALGAYRIQHSSLIQVRHEGILLAHNLEAAIAPLAAAADIDGIQKYINRLVTLREKNDLEINVLFLTAQGSDIAASNVPDNIEHADEEEHLAVLNALHTGQPDLFVEVEDGPENEEEERFAADPSHPDYYFPKGSRTLCITTPLTHDGKEIGGLNIKLSLHYLDRERMALFWSAAAMLLTGCGLMCFVLTPFLKRNLFSPLHHLAAEMYAFGTSGEIGQLAPSLREDEIGVLETEFFNMATRINSAEAMRRELELARAEKEKHELEAKLRQSQKMEALGTLAGGIAHDFNNILTPIMGYTQILMNDENEKDELHQIYQASVRAQDLVKQILTFSRQNENEKTAVLVSPIIKETLKLIRASIPAYIRIDARIQEDTQHVVANSTHIHQIILNLATNAAHAMMEEGGTLRVHVEEINLEHERLLPTNELLQSGSYITLTVADTGSGIPEDIQERIFEPYFTTKEEGEGTGLGLAMVHGIVEDMGGAIELETQAGIGTCFTLYLPTAEASHEQIEIHHDLPLGSGQRILLVDDEAPITRMLSQMLETLGYRPFISATPHQALHTITHNPAKFDALITDVAMPTMTGLELARNLNSKEITIPVICISGYTGGINPRAAAEFGVRAILLKPVDQQKLAQTIFDTLRANVRTSVEPEEVVVF